MTTIRVQLAESPTDVLVWLVGSQPHARTREEIAAAMTHLHPDLVADDALRATARALRLLHELRFVQTRGNEVSGLRWFPTAEGIEVVREAKDGLRSADPVGGSSHRNPADSSPALPAKSKEME